MSIPRTLFPVRRVRAAKPWSKWGVWAMWGGSDRSLGSLTIDGHFLADSTLFSEVREANGQCSTDLNKGYLDNPRFWNTSVSEGVYSSATAEYEDNCENTTWKQISGDYVRDERETERIIDPDEVVCNTSQRASDLWVGWPGSARLRYRVPRLMLRHIPRGTDRIRLSDRIHFAEPTPYRYRLHHYVRGHLVGGS